MRSEAEKQIEAWSRELREAPVGQSFVVRGGGTKPGLASANAGFAAAPTGPVADEGWVRQPRSSDGLVAASQSVDPVATVPRTLDLGGLQGVIEYCPAEFTITVYAGTPVTQVLETLREHGQYLPFESPYHGATARDETVGNTQRQDLAARTTVGGLVAAGINGPGRLRHGGIRDFILEVRYLDGDGVIRRGGRRVVKNAAGFDIPKLMVGSCGRLGVLLDVTFKVFPQPTDYLTMRVMSENVDSTVEILATLATHPWDLDALEVQPDGSVLIRLAGHSDALVKHGQRIQSRLSKFYSSFLTGPQQQQVWSAYADWLWGQADQALVRVPVSLRCLFDFDEQLDEMDIQRAYGSGGHVAWLRWQPSPENPGTRFKRLHKYLVETKRGGQLIQGPGPTTWLGDFPGQAFYQRLKNVFDPRGRLGNF